MLPAAGYSVQSLWFAVISGIQQSRCRLAYFIFHVYGYTLEMVGEYFEATLAKWRANGTQTCQFPDLNDGTRS
ncbi:MAG: hypothetical protein WC236_09450 [Gallionellaceae bacterium]|jgi:hypothetical protein